MPSRSGVDAIAKRFPTSPTYFHSSSTTTIQRSLSLVRLYSPRIFTGCALRLGNPEEYPRRDGEKGICLSAQVQQARKDTIPPGVVSSTHHQSPSTIEFLGIYVPCSLWSITTSKSCTPIFCGRYQRRRTPMRSYLQGLSRTRPQVRGTRVRVSPSSTGDRLSETMTNQLRIHTPPPDSTSTMAPQFPADGTKLTPRAEMGHAGE